MNPGALTPEFRSAAPALGAQLGGAILLPLAALIAHAFLRNPARVGIILLLWTRLRRAARRFDSLMSRVARGTEQPRPPRPGRERDIPATPSRPRLRLPAPHGWLLKDLKHEAAVYTNRLDRLLSEPAIAAITARAPQALRLLRPLCHMLGLRHAAVPPLPRRRKPPAPPAVAEQSARPGLVEAMTAKRRPPQAERPAAPPSPERSHPTPRSPPMAWLPWTPARAT